MTRIVVICDFCTTPNPSWRFEARPFLVDYGELVGHSDGSWAACDECCRLILAGNRGGLVERPMNVAPAFAKRAGLTITRERRVTH